MSAGKRVGELLDFFLPTGCIACGSWIGGGTALVCALCRSRLHVPPWPRCPRCHKPRGTRRAEAPDCLECRAWPRALTAARYAYSLEGPTDDLVHALKYEGWTELADFMARALSRLDPPSPGSVGSVPRADVGKDYSARRAAPSPAARVIVPVPTTAERLRERGYNQAGMIADRLADRLGMRVASALRRRSGARSQTSLSPDARRRNVKGVFRPAHLADDAVRASHVLLVDDVLTTGATAAEAAMTLQAMGAESVTLLTFARALPSRRKRAA